MKVIGIIAEFNPFHNGHEYLIKKAREIVGDNRAVVMTVMSGPFMQRGTPSIFPKHVRAKQALLCGSDLVIEIPFTFACAPSERFANGAVELLYRTGVVTDLVFGIDSESEDLIKELSGLNMDEVVLKAALAEGKSFPSARSEALISEYRKLHTDISEDELDIVRNALRQPNSILALDYLKAVKTSGARFNIHMIKRTPNASATNAREKYFESNSTIASIADNLNGLLPDKSLAVALSQMSSKNFSFPNKDLYVSDAKDLISREDISEYAYMTDGLSGYLNNTFEDLRDYSYDSIMSKLSTKHYTMPRIRRAISSLIVNQKNSYVESQKHVQYIRVLGFSKEGRYCLKVMSKCARLPIISNCSDALELYSAKPMLKEQFELDLRANNIQAKYLNMEQDYEWKLAPVIVK